MLGPSGPGTELTLEQDGGALVRRSVLPGGIRVLTESMPGQRSVSMGAWIAVGSRDEHDGHHGSTHFLEHLLFKGTARRDAMEIATAFDAVGGEANASTGKEYTCYYARVLDADLPMAVDVITDMVTSATLDAGEFETERGVILEELAMNDDDPSDVAHEQFAAAVFGAHPLGRPIGGTPGSIRSVPRDAVWEHYRRTYAPPELVVTAAGSVDHEALCAQIADGVAGPWTLDDAAAPVSRRVAGGTVAGLPDAGTAITVRRSTEQANVVLGAPGLVATDPRRFTMSVLNAVLGGGMSSRLFQEVRERRGLAYSVYSFATGYAEAGAFGVYAGCAPSKVADVTRILGEQWEQLAADGITAEELERGVGQLSGSLVLGLEDSGSRMSRLGRSEIVFGELVSVDETLERLRAVTADDVRELAAELAAGPRSLVVVGPFDHDIAGEALAR
ncbi:peptidase M16 domain protein [Beutenbergia cavernae DSM 12333]|uniref:Peptidase M16 domain protein n=1 Tax=Beutenbergia cavernae (strain ATCC BAA-8 / DSM 12333 / CCUG 43141 / JCM 11478 / NBRC 16432 / NCIMB 13614 / HKI 0122) TaxID=471853 RepID=C5BWR1_BEUC1|nr:peptidase M16 domain protein [Beutenbergia cavernae DSM 12333]